MTILLKRSRWQLSIDMAEHRNIFKKYRNTTSVLFSHPKQVSTPEKQVLHLYCAPQLQLSQFTERHPSQANWYQ